MSRDIFTSDVTTDRFGCTVGRCPIRVETRMDATIQALDWRCGGRYLPLRDDIGSTAFSYHERISVGRQVLPVRDALEATRPDRQ